MKFGPSLGELLVVADSGTWGEEGEPGVGDAVLRSTNIQDSTLVLDDVAWRVVPVKDRERRVLKTGDILVTKSSGSPDHIGKCCLFVEPGDRRYYFSNFTLRLRADQSKVDPRWIFYWLSSSMGRDVLTRINNTTTGLRNLDVTRYLAQQIPTPSLHEQCHLADILDKADTIRRKRKEAIALTEELLRSAFLEMFGDPVANPKHWPTVTIGEVAHPSGSLVDGPFGSSLKPEHYVSMGVRVVRNFNIHDDFFDGSQFKYVTDTKFEEIRRSEVAPGDILLTTKGTVGDICVMPPVDGPSVLAASGSVRLRLPADAGLSAEFVVSQMILPSYKRYLHGFEAGSAQQYLNLSGIRKMRLIKPSRADQERFLEQKSRIRALASRLRSSADDAQTLFDSLAGRAFETSIS